MEKQTKKMNRREFLSLSALGLASFTILPSWSVNGQNMHQVIGSSLALLVWAVRE